jgi:hypothetical protein
MLCAQNISDVLHTPQQLSIIEPVAVSDTSLSCRQLLAALPASQPPTHYTRRSAQLAPTTAFVGEKRIS